MENKVALSAPLSDLDPTRKVRSVDAAPARSSQPPAPAPQQDQADLRLVIEEVGNTGSFVYKTVDRRTGVVVNQLPREEVVKLKESETYASGSVVQAKA